MILTRELRKRTRLIISTLENTSRRQFISLENEVQSFKKPHNSAFHTSITSFSSKDPHDEDEKSTRVKGPERDSQKSMEPEDIASASSSKELPRDSFSKLGKPIESREEERVSEPKEIWEDSTLLGKMFPAGIEDDHILTQSSDNANKTKQSPKFPEKKQTSLEEDDKNQNHLEDKKVLDSLNLPRTIYRESKDSIIIDPKKPSSNLRSKELGNNVADNEFQDAKLAGSKLKSKTQPASAQKSSKARKSSISTPPPDYPKLLLLPITGKPFFPGMFKHARIQDKAVIEAIKDLMARNEPYIGVFVLNDPESTVDTVSSMEEVEPVGVFAHVTALFDSLGPDGGAEIVIYPYRRIKITSIRPPKQQVDPGVESENLLFDIDNSDTLQKSSSSVSKNEGSAEFLMNHAVTIANVENFPNPLYDVSDPVIKVLMSQILVVLRAIAIRNSHYKEQVGGFGNLYPNKNIFEDPVALADFATATSITSGRIDSQLVLASSDIQDRLEKALVIIRKDLTYAELQSKMAQDIQSKYEKRQREALLHEQLKQIKKELGGEDSKDQTIVKFKKRAAELLMPEPVKLAFDEEIAKLSASDPNHTEYSISRTYLEWITSLPWGLNTVDTFNLSNAEKILNEDHYGMKDVKDRILEFLAVGKLKGNVQGKILCLSGPPGVGKTSIGKSIARALNRNFYRFSVGGIYDSSEIKGHRRTYVGAMPGKLAQALKKVQSENPVILIDEIDKLHKGNHGDPSSSLLEVLDPEQNTSFMDHYLDVPLDLSRVMFVCTANTLDTISAPLLDRMEVIELSGYVSEEKAEIAKKYLSPRAKDLAGLSEADVNITPEAINNLIKSYCRESGVRNLKKHIDKIYRKAAFKIVKDIGEDPVTNNNAHVLPGKSDQDDVKPPQESISSPHKTTSTSVMQKGILSTSPTQPIPVPDTVHLTISADNLKDFVGREVYKHDRIYANTPPAGVSIGLGYNGNGGCCMPIEVSSMPGKGNVKLTGKLGDVIQESAQIAFSWVKGHAFDLGITSEKNGIVLNDVDIHIHMPEGAVGKDGPSAGSAITCAIISMLSKLPIDQGIAMTGEISLVGQILPVGGLREKLLAADRTGMTKVILPASCQSDVEENVPSSVTSRLELVYVDDIRQVIQIVFGQSDLSRRMEERLPLQENLRIPGIMPIT